MEAVGVPAAPQLLPSDSLRTGEESVLSLEGFREVSYYFRYLKQDWPLALGMILSSTISNILRLPLFYLPVLLFAHFDPKFSYDSGVQSDGSNLGIVERFFVSGLRYFFGTSNYLSAAIVFTVTCIILLAPIQLVRAYCAGQLGANFLLRLRMAVFNNLKRMNMLSVYERGAGPFVQRLTRDLMMVHDLLVHTLSGSVNLTIQTFIFLTAALLTEPIMTLVVLGIYLAMQPVLLIISRRIRAKASLLQQGYEAVTTQMLECIGGYRDIIAGGHFEGAAIEFKTRSERLRSQAMRLLYWSQGGEFLLNVTFGCLTVMPYLHIMGRLNNVEEIGHAISFVGLLSSLLPSLAGIWGVTVELSSARPSLEAVHYLIEPSVFDKVPLINMEHTLAELPDVVRSIRFEGVGLKLDGHWIVQDLTFEIRGGEFTALIGQSGSGKTTIFHLLLRLIEPTCGTIWINDVVLSQFDDVSLRRLIGFIPQNAFIFNRSIRDNLLLAEQPTGNVAALLKDAVSAARLDDLIKSRETDGGLDSSAGYMGMRLSAGERQRVALGRLLLQDPKVIICDEYTANIDAKTAQLIQEMMRTRFHDRTRLVITHELYNARGASSILVLDEGRIVQSGSHEQLLQEPGMYRTMWESQRLD